MYSYILSEIKKECKLGITILQWGPKTKLILKNKHSIFVQVRNPPSPDVNKLKHKGKVIKLNIL